MNESHLETVSISTLVGTGGDVKSTQVTIVMPLLSMKSIYGYLCSC